MERSFPARRTHRLIPDGPDYDVCVLIVSPPPELTLLDVLIFNKGLLACCHLSVPGRCLWLREGRSLTCSHTADGYKPLALSTEAPDPASSRMTA